MDIQDLSSRAIAVAAHHIQDPRPTEPAGTVPDDGSPAYATAELRRIVYWSLDQSPTGQAMLQGLSSQPGDPGLRYHAAQVLAGDLQQYPHLVPAVASFIGRAWAQHAVPAGVMPTSAMPTGAMPAGYPAPAPAPWPAVQTQQQWPGAPEPAPRKAFQIGGIQIGWGTVAIVLAIVLVLAGGGTTAAILLTRKASPPAAAVRYHGSQTFGSIDLDQNPPGAGAGMDVMATFGPDFEVANNAIGAAYGGSGTPTKDQCQQVLARDGSGGQGVVSGATITDKVVVGMSFCVSTRGGNVAYLKVTQVTDSSFTADVTVWGQ